MSAGWAVAAQAPQRRHRRCDLDGGDRRGGASGTPPSSTVRCCRARCSAILAGLWSLRLALHLAHRVLGEPEDGRYRQLREHWHGHQGKMFLMFQFQALLIVSFSIPFLAVARNPVPSVTPVDLHRHRRLDRERQPARRSRTASSRAFARIRLIAAAPAAQASGGTRAIRIISSNGCTGSHTSRSPWEAAWPGCRSWVRFSCTCSCDGSAASPSPRRRRCAPAATTTAAISEIHAAFISLVSEGATSMNAITIRPPRRHMPRMTPSRALLGWAERGFLPDALVR